MTLLLLPMLIFMGIYMFALGQNLGFLSPTNLFLYMQLIMAIGSLPLLDVKVDADRVHAALIVSTFLALLLASSALIFLYRSTELRFTGEVVLLRPKAATWVLIGISTVICVAYYVAIGYVAVFESLVAVLTGSSVDIAGLRLESYSGEKYLFPGYVNQFKNVLLPALVVSVVVYFFNVKNRARYFIALALILPTGIFLLGTSQRGPFITFLIVVVVFVYLLSPGKFPRRLLFFAAAGFPLFVLSTIALGRSKQDLTGASNLFESLWILIGQVFFRVFGSNQESSVAGFKYIYDSPTQGGSDWWLNLVGMLPGVPGSDLDNRIHSIMYGSDRGTAPPSIWGSAYYNFGFAGAIIFALLMAVVLFFVSRTVSKWRELSSLQALGYAGMTTVLGTWLAGSPTYLFNAGLVIYILLWLWGSHQSQGLKFNMKFWQRQNKSQSGDRDPGIIPPRL